ncbi:hypothetical protein JZ751_023890, partial [Albula glossodonta]
MGGLLPDADEWSGRGVVRPPKHLARGQTSVVFAHLTPGGKAAQAGVGVGDWVVSISDSNAEEMTHVEAQNKIRAATDSLTLTLTRAFHPAGSEQK